MAGVLLILADAIWRLLPKAIEALSGPLSTIEKVGLVAVVFFMGAIEGYRGFQKAFSPRVAARALALAHRAPLPKALAVQDLGNSQYTFWGIIQADGGSPVTGVAFEVADNMVFRNSSLHTATILAGTTNFSTTATLQAGKRYYYRAVAANAAGSTKSSPKRLITPDDGSKWWSDSILNQGGWRTSPWFGAFRPYENGWIYHAKLGWVVLVFLAVH